MEELLNRHYLFCSSAYTQARSLSTFVCLAYLPMIEMLVFCAHEKHIKICAMKSPIGIHLVPMYQLISALLSNSRANYTLTGFHTFLPYKAMEMKLMHCQYII
jgi:hypothetical protein